MGKSPVELERDGTHQGSISPGAGGRGTFTQSHNFPGLELGGRFMSVCFVLMLHNLHIESSLLDASARLKKKKSTKYNSTPFFGCF